MVYFSRRSWPLFQLLYTDIDVIKISWTTNDWGFIQPKIEMKEVMSVSYPNKVELSASLLISPNEFKWLRYGKEDNPFITMTGDWGSKQILLSRYVLPETKPSKADVLYRSGDTIKIS